MPINVYVWNFLGTKDSWGHASMTLSDGTHISWWPSANDRKSKKGKALQAPAVRNESLQEDIYDEDNRQPDDTCEIPDGYINEGAIKKWWDSFSVKADWRALKQNCSTVVFMALREGSALRYFPDDERNVWETRLIWTPNAVGEFANLLVKHIKKNVRGQSKPEPSNRGYGNFAGMAS